MRFHKKVLVIFVVVGSVEWVQASPLKPECKGNCENNGQTGTQMTAVIKQHENNFIGNPNGGHIIGAKIEQNNNFNGSENGGTSSKALIIQDVNNFGSSTADRRVQEAGSNQKQTTLSFASGSNNQNSEINPGVPQAPGYPTNDQPPKGYLCYQYAPNGRPLYAYSPASYSPNGYPATPTLYKFIVCGTVTNPGQQSSPGSPVLTHTGANPQAPMLPKPTPGNAGGSGNEPSTPSLLNNPGSADVSTSSPVLIKPKPNEHRVDSQEDDAFAKDGSTTSLPPTGSKNATQKIDSPANGV